MQDRVTLLKNQLLGPFKHLYVNEDLLLLDRLLVLLSMKTV